MRGETSTRVLKTVQNGCAMSEETGPEEPHPSSVGSVRSNDGTAIGYYDLGQGPGLILVHGAGQSSENLRTLARELSDAFTVYVPDRRGRGMTGPYGSSMVYGPRSKN